MASTALANAVKSMTFASCAVTLTFVVFLAVCETFVSPPKMLLKRPISQHLFKQLIAKDNAQPHNAQRDNLIAGQWLRAFRDGLGPLIQAVAKPCDQSR